LDELLKQSKKYKAISWDLEKKAMYIFSGPGFGLDLGPDLN